MVSPGGDSGRFRLRFAVSVALRQLPQLRHPAERLSYSPNCCALSRKIECAPCFSWPVCSSRTSHDSSTRNATCGLHCGLAAVCGVDCMPPALPPTPWHGGPSWRCHFGPLARCHQHFIEFPGSGRSRSFRLDNAGSESPPLLTGSRHRSRLVAATIPKASRSRRPRSVPDASRWAPRADICAEVTHHRARHVGLLKRRAAGRPDCRNTLSNQ